MGRKKTNAHGIYQPQSQSQDEGIRAVPGRRDRSLDEQHRRKGLVQSYLQSLSSTQLQDLFAVEVSSIKNHFSTSTTTPSGVLSSVLATMNRLSGVLSNALSTLTIPSEVLPAAVSFAMANNGSWTFRFCFICQDIFSDFESFTAHQQQRHITALRLPEFQLVCPRSVDAPWAEVISNGCWKPIDVPATVKMLQEQPQCQCELWPTSDDPERTNLLRKIQISLQILLKSNLLCANQLDLLLEIATCALENLLLEIAKFATCALETLPCGSTLLNIGGNDFPHVFICLLGAKKLESIFKVLQEVRKSSEADSLPDDPILHISRNKMVQGASLVQDSSILVLETSFPVKGGMGVFSADDVFFWLYNGLTLEESFLVWDKLVKQRLKRISKIYGMLSEKEALLCSLHITKRCLVVGKEKNNDVELTIQESKTFLTKWKKEDTENEDATVDLFSAAIRELEENNEDCKVLESDIDDDYDTRMQDNLNQEKSCKPMLLHGQNELNIRLDKINAKMLKILGSLIEIDHKFESASTLTYLTPLIPLVKSFLLASIEEAAEKSAKEKAQAAYESLMAEENDAHRSTKSGGSDKKQAKKKLKDKKDKDPKKFNGRKNVGCSEQSLPQQTLEEQEVLVATDGNLVKTEHDRQSSQVKELEEEDKAKNLEAVMPTVCQNIGDEPSNMTMHLNASSDTSRAQENLSGVLSPELSSLEDDVVALTNDPNSDILITKDFLGTGLKNEVGEYNCFLNVIIQSLWHIRRFRDEFHRTLSMHNHVGDPCVTCTLDDVFADLIKSSENAIREPGDPAPLRLALSNLYPEKFQLAKMSDASEALQVILNCLHQSFTSSDDCNANLGDINCVSAGYSESNNCIAHALFGMELRHCGSESKNQKYTTFFQLINAAELRRMKDKYADRSFDELLKDSETDHLPSDTDAESSSKPNYMGVLSTPPHVFTIVLVWQSENEDKENISATLDAITTEVDIGVLYDEIDQGSKHHLAAVVCYHGQHYICFAYSAEHGNWIMYNDQTIKVAGSWNDIRAFCTRELLQPTILFFEAVQ